MSWPFGNALIILITSTAVSRMRRRRENFITHALASEIQSIGAFLEKPALIQAQ